MNSIADNMQKPQTKLWWYQPKVYKFGTASRSTLGLGEILVYIEIQFLLLFQQTSNLNS